MNQYRPDGMLLPSAFSDNVLAYLEQSFRRLSEKTSASVHEETLSKFQWHGLKSGKTCLVCLTGVPQHKAQCGHSFCENCLIIYGCSEMSDPWLLRREFCILCQKPAEIVIRVRPPTAGHSILCIDGGGVRGIIPLMMLVMLEEQLDLPIPIQELFTLSYGTSVGMWDNIIGYV